MQEVRRKLGITRKSSQLDVGAVNKRECKWNVWGQLDFALARFFFLPEVRREDGQEYLWETLCEMKGTIQTSLRVQCERTVTLMTKKVLHLEV